jgi:FkbM family methyltransferase
MPSFLYQKVRPYLVSLGENLGLYIRRNNIYTSPDLRLGTLLNLMSTEMAIDVGANKGQYAQHLRTVGYRGKIISIEPIPEMHCELEKRSNNDPNWVVHDRCGLGETPGELQLNISQNYVSSSFLGMKKRHEIATPESQFCRAENVKIDTLDSICDSYQIKAEHHAFCKIDVQGFERQVITGGMKHIHLFAAFQTEVSLVQLYDNQMLIGECLEIFKDIGFEPFSIDRGFTDGSTGQLLQCNILFVRADICENLAEKSSC